MMPHYETFNLSVQGASHIAKNIPCQDYSTVFSENGYKAAVVCDGHGGAIHFRSADGSKMAAEAALSQLKLFYGMQSEYIGSFKEDYNKILNGLEKSIILKWNQLVSDFNSSNPLQEEELSILRGKSDVEAGDIEVVYGTTLVAAFLSEKYWFGIQIGDGNLAALLEDGKIYEPLPENENNVGNITASLCLTDAITQFRHFYGEDVPKALFVTTDGVKNSFNESSAYYNFLSKIYLSFATLPYEQAFEDLKKYLPVLSEKGSGDDMSISCIYMKDDKREL